jgi:dynein heavy chain
MSSLEEIKTIEAPLSELLINEDVILLDEEVDVPPEEPLVLPPDKPWLKEWVTDMRLEWLQQKVCIGLNMPWNVFNSVIQKEEDSKQIRSFLDGSLSCLLFYLDEVVTIIETIVEPPPPPPLPPPLPEEEKPKEEEGGEGNVLEEASKTKEDAKGKKEDKKDKKKDKKEDAKGGKKNKKGDKKGKKGGKKDKEEPSMELELEPKKAEEDQIQRSKEGAKGGSGESGDVSNEEPKTENPPKPQIIYTEKRDPILCASTGVLPEKALSKSVIYFLKMKSGSLTEEQLDHDLESGLLPSGPGMSALEKVI